MKKCWALNPRDRPTFIELRCIIERILQKAAGYLELNMVLSVSPESTVTKFRIVSYWCMCIALCGLMLHINLVRLLKHLFKTTYIHLNFH